MPGTRRSTPTAGVRQDALRRDNLGLLLRHVHLAGAASRSTLVELTGLNRSTIGALATALTDAGLVREQVPSLTTSVGRPSLVLVPESTRVLVVAVEVTAAAVTVVSVGLGGAVLERRSATAGPGVDEVVAATTRLVGEVLAARGPGARCAGTGVAVPGLVRASDGLVRVAPNLGWREVPLGDLLTTALAAAGAAAGPVVVANEADLGARSEHLRGAARGCDDVVYLSGQVGLGAGVITAGHPLGGRGGYAGEVGHLVLDPAGRPCHCGSRGCWETEVNEEALLGSTGGGLAAVADLVAAAGRGDAAARAVLDRVGDRLGQGLAGLVNLLNPEVVVLGGHLAVVLPAVRDRVEAVLATAALAAPREQARLALPELGADSALLGAAELAFTPLLADPLGGLARLPAAG